MALTKITYATKTALNPQPSISAENKVTDADMNEIKTVVNNAIDQVDANTANISVLQTDIEYETPIKTGRRFKVGNTWKDEYIYYKNVGTLPNTNTSVTIQTTLDKSAITLITGTGGVAVNSSGTTIIFNADRPNDVAGGAAALPNYSNDKFTFFIEVGRDRSAFTGHCWVTYY
jgi:hypothetical protein